MKKSIIGYVKLFRYEVKEPRLNEDGQPLVGKDGNATMVCKKEIVRYREIDSSMPQFTIYGKTKRERNAQFHILSSEINSDEVIKARIKGITFKQYKEELHLKKKRDESQEELNKVELKDFIDEYLEYVKSVKSLSTYKNYFSSFKQFLNYCKLNNIILVKQVNFKLMSNYKLELLKKYKARTVEARINSLKSLFTYSVKQGLLLLSPLRDLETTEIPEVEIKVFKTGEFEKLLDCIRIKKPDYCLMLRFAMATSARFVEITEILTKANFELKERGEQKYYIISITNNSRHTKNYRNRKVDIIDQDLVKDLSIYLNKFQQDELPFGNVDKSKGVWFKRFVMEAGLDPSYHFHMIRKTSLTNLSKELSVFELCQWAGHRSMDVTKSFYVHIDADKIASKRLKGLEK